MKRLHQALLVALLATLTAPALGDNDPMSEVEHSSDLDDEKMSRYMSGYVGTRIALVIERQKKRFAGTIIRSEAIEQSGGFPTRIAAAEALPQTHSYITAHATPSPTPRISRPTATKSGAPAIPISIKRHTKESDAVQTDVITALALIPKTLMQEVVSADIKVMITLLGYETLLAWVVRDNIVVEEELEPDVLAMIQPMRAED